MSLWPTIFSFWLFLWGVGGEKDNCGHFDSCRISPCDSLQFWDKKTMFFNSLFSPLSPMMFHTTFDDWVPFYIYKKLEFMHINVTDQNPLTPSEACLQSARSFDAVSAESPWPQILQKMMLLLLKQLEPSLPNPCLVLESTFLLSPCPEITDCPRNIVTFHKGQIIMWSLSKLIITTWSSLP